MFSLSSNVLNYLRIVADYFKKQVLFILALNSYHKQKFYQFQVFPPKQALSYHSHVENSKPERTGKDFEKLKSCLLGTLPRASGF